ncbi:MAG: DUF1015 domain-containing protein [Acidobacteria bacterium]|nr:DUF1015 domain-containing protein [Acidobacteriota bacterium]MCW5967992.1 DUF1015 domain-containing protein [Blastocatellales bacterium]
MAIVKPFRALRPTPEKAAEVSAVPYDVVNTAEARALAAGNPLSFLHVSRPEIDLADDVDPHADEVYNLAAQNFDALTAKAPLLIEDDPSFYFYRLRMGAHTQTGLVACCSVDEYDGDLIRKHERTRKDKEDDRTRHMLTLRAQTGPVFLTYQPNARINAVAAVVSRRKPLFDFTAPDGVAHTVWRIPTESNDAVAAAFAEIGALYIADGHHRAKSASRARESLRDANPEHTGGEEYNFFQCVLFPADQVQILAYNRIVKDLHGLSKEDFLKKTGEEFEISDDAPATPQSRGDYGMYLDGRWYGLKLRREVTRPIRVTDGMDVSILQDKLLSPILGIRDVRTDKRIDFVGGIRGAEALERLVNDGAAAVAFSLFPVTVAELMQVSDAGEIMPPKSTWFEPKLRDGLLSHLI